MNSSDVKIWEVRFACENGEEYGWQLLELGADGLEVLEANFAESDQHSAAHGNMLSKVPKGTDSIGYNEVVRCGFRGTEGQLLHFLAEAEALGFHPLGTRLDQPELWVQRWDDVWKPVIAGHLTIRPITGAPSEILIVPGSGFGTGHHETTSMMLELMQERFAAGHPPHRVLDVGTGSGILAIAAHKLHPNPTQLHVEAIDNDPLSLQNVAINLHWNQLAKKVKVSDMPLPTLCGPYDLILANIYADVLEEFRPNFARLSKFQTELLLSGILPEQAERVLTPYLIEHGGAWELVSQKHSGGWVAYRLRKGSASMI